MFDFTDRVALVTGATGNLGAGVANAFARAGARLVLFDRSSGKLAGLFPELAGSERHHLADSVDATDAPALARLAQEATDRFGRIDILVNTIGGYRAGPPLHETAPETWDFMMALNAGTVWNACQAVIGQMIRQQYGKIVSVAARAALAGTAGAAAYNASKSAVVRLTESMAAELKAHNINVNCVLPSAIDTPQNRQAQPEADTSKWITVAELANVILFLCSDEAGAVQGAAIPVYGRS
jgi:NAD(P)-dependent dehydrogenase (short-subunit alcohol dehydrogenase family)